MISSTEKKMLENRMFFSGSVKTIKEFEESVIVNSSGSIFAIDKDLFQRYSKYILEKNIVITASNEYALGKIKSLIFSNNLDYDYHSYGYAITNKSFEDFEKEILEIPDVEYFILK